jgi:hypothetical protein
MTNVPTEGLAGRRHPLPELLTRLPYVLVCRSYDAITIDEAAEVTASCDVHATPLRCRFDAGTGQELIAP